MNYRQLVKQLWRSLNFVVVMALVLPSAMTGGQPMRAQATSAQVETQDLLPVISEETRQSIERITPPAMVPTDLTNNSINGEQVVAPLVSASALTSPGLSITRNGTNIQLTWTTVAGSQFYEVHRSTAPFFIPSVATLVQTLAAGAASYTDNGAAGDPNVNHYYIVQAVNGSEKTDSNTVGEIGYALNNAGSKYSLIALPFPSATIVNAASLASHIGNVGALLKWNPTTQTFRFFSPPASGDNFPVTVGDAIFVLVNSGGPSVVTMTGTVTPVQHNLRPSGFNFVSLPLQQTNLTAANLLATDVTGAQALLSWNEATQLFRFFTPPASGDNFAVKPGAPIIIQLGSTVATAWPSALPPVVDAPPINTTVATSLYDATSFLYTGSNPVQTGVQPGTIELKRTAVLRGRVLDRAGNPLPGATITVLNHPEYGQTLSRDDGLFDMAVNGGGALTVQYKKTGYPPLQRTLEAGWQQYEWLPNAVLTPYDAQVTTVNLNAAAAFQVARGSVSSDSDGTRQATVLFPQGTTATITLPNGTTQSLSTLHVRLTEYTVGDLGPEAMPAALPPQSAYTYAIELTADEALANGVKVAGKDVIFNQPVPIYVDNFLNFPVGTVVPTGYYDNNQGQWIPYDNGRVIKILNISGGVAEIDTDGDTVADSGATVGITTAERTTLATLYGTGKTLWRVSLTHFSTWDFNWGDFDNCDPQLQSCFPPPPGDCCDPPDPDPCEQESSIIECQNQTLGERIGLVGTPFTLNYRSDRVPGRGRTLILSLSEATIPAGLKRIELELLVAGQRVHQDFAPTPNQSYTFQWDGRDVYGRAVQGATPVIIRMGYVYDGWYMAPPTDGRAFGRVTNVPILQAHTRDEHVVFQQFQAWLFGWDAQGQGLGGWTLDVQHVYDPDGQVLYLGDGSRRDAATLPRTITTVAGTGFGGFTGDNGPAAAARISTNVRGIATDAQGNLYLSDWGNNRLRKVNANGIITTIAGTGTAGFSGDGGLAINARLNGPEGIAIDGQGNLFVADLGNQRIRKIAPNGIITTVAGNGVSGQGADGVPATQSNLFFPLDVAVGPDGTFYIAESGTGARIRSVSPDGIIATAVQSVSPDVSSIWLVNPRGLVVDHLGNLFFPSHGQRVYRLSPDGKTAHVAGGGAALGDGGLATGARIGVAGMAVDRFGNLFITDNFHYRIRKVSPDGSIMTIAGSGAGSGGGGFGGDAGPATRARLNQPSDVAIDEAGNLYIADTSNVRIRKVSTPFPQFAGSFAIAAEDGSAVYLFDGGGRHLRTVNALTGATLYTFGYDPAGRLTSVTDGDGNITTVERAGDGSPTAIIGPYGQRTTLSLDANGYLASISNPAGETTQMSYGANGLLTSFTDPRGHTSQMQYDALGRLIRDENPAGGVWAINRIESTNSYSVAMTTALGRTTFYRVEDPPTGNKRRVNIRPNGLQTADIRNTDGSRQVTYSDSVVTTLVQGPDPRWGMQAPVLTSLTSRTPGDLVATYGLTRTVTLTEPTNPLSLATMTRIMRVNGRTYTSNYQAASRAMLATTPAGRQSTLIVDTLGRVTSAQIPGLNVTSYTYDTRGRLATMTQGSGAQARTITFSYNNNGYLTTVTDPLNQTASFVYDAAGRVTQQTLADGRVIGYTYDANGNLTSLTPPGRPAHSFTYTPVDLTATYTPPDVGAGSHQTQYTYNLDRQLTQIMRPDNQMLLFSYDNAGRLSSMTTPRGIMDYTYHPTTGNLATLSAPDGIGLAYSYDGNLLTSVTWSGSVAGTVNYTYDNDFRVTATSVNGANPIALRYDQDSLLTQAGALTLSRHPQNGLLTGSTLGSVADSWSYNGFAEPVNYHATFSGADLYTVQYTRDKLGRITAKTETIGGVTNTYGYSYDLAGRLTQVTKNNATIAAYTYDSNGNRLSYTDPSGAITGSYDTQDRLLQYGATTYTYTANGELLTKTTGGQTTAYQYDALGNLMTVALPDGTQIDYLVDGHNRRIGKKVNGVLVQGFLYQDQLRPIAEVDGNNTIVSRFIYANRPNVPDYMIKDGITYRIITDHLGSPRLVVNISTGVIAQRLDYDEFGRIISDTNPSFQPFGFAGGIYDSDTKITHFDARDYVAEIGRWSAKDPIEFKGGDTSLYTYVFNDPLNFKDPGGMDWLPIIGGGVTVVGRAIGNNPVSVGGGAFVVGYTAGQKLLQSHPKWGTDAGDWWCDRLRCDQDTGWRPHPPSNPPIDPDGGILPGGASPNQNPNGGDSGDAGIPPGGVSPDGGDGGGGGSPPNPDRGPAPGPGGGPPRPTPCP